jgi:hypothetical protein
MGWCDTSNCKVTQSGSGDEAHGGEAVELPTEGAQARGHRIYTCQAYRVRTPRTKVKLRTPSMINLRWWVEWGRTWGWPGTAFCGRSGRTSTRTPPTPIWPLPPPADAGRPHKHVHGIGVAVEARVVPRRVRETVRPTCTSVSPSVSSRFRCALSTDTTCAHAPPQRVQRFRSHA